MFQDAQKFVKQLASNGGTILMVGTKRQAREMVAAEAQRAGVPFVDQRWLGGMLTNFKTVKTSIKRREGNEGPARSRPGSHEQEGTADVHRRGRSRKLGIPLVGVVDSNHNPEGIDYVIPGNDDSAKAVQLYAKASPGTRSEGRAAALTDVVKAASGESGDEFVEVEESAA
ncbi:28S ribosomal protein S2, mitochondrial [Manis javanica]|nr:28S ribosomal protein S2, mitochondrial [Manis javanica]